jgi:hypothetical protein
MQKEELKKIIHDMSNSITISAGSIELLDRKMHEGSSDKNKKYIDTLRLEIVSLMHKIQEHLKH